MDDFAEHYMKTQYTREPLIDLDQGRDVRAKQGTLVPVVQPWRFI